MSKFDKVLKQLISSCQQLDLEQRKNVKLSNEIYDLKHSNSKNDDGCDLCNASECIHADHTGQQVSLSNNLTTSWGIKGGLVLGSYDSNIDGIVYINYCPICGRKLSG